MALGIASGTAPDVKSGTARRAPTEAAVFCGWVLQSGPKIKKMLKGLKMVADEGLAAVIFGVYGESLRKGRTKNYLF